MWPFLIVSCCSAIGELPLWRVLMLLLGRSGPRTRLDHVERVPELPVLPLEGISDVFALDEL